MHACIYLQILMNVKVVTIVLNYALILLILIIALVMKDMKWKLVMVGLNYANSQSYSICMLYVHIYVYSVTFLHNLFQYF